MVEITAGEFGELRGGTSLGLSLGSTAVCFPLKNARNLALTPRNFTTAVVARFAINPLLVVLKTADALSTAPTNYSDAAQDGDTGTDVVLSSLSTAANEDFIYVGMSRPIRGLRYDADAANGNASVLTGKYWDGTAWVDIALTDGTIAAGACFGQDGDITWAIPTAWRKAALMEIGDAKCAFRHANTPLYWVRLQVSAALDSSTTGNSLMPLAPSTDYYELASGQTLELAIDRENAGSIEALVDAGTGFLVTNYARVTGGRF